MLLYRVYHICDQMSKIYPHYLLHSTLPNFEKKLCNERYEDVLHVRTLLLVRYHI